jgi:hypothetical protein
MMANRLFAAWRGSSDFDGTHQLIRRSAGEQPERQFIGGAGLAAAPFPAEGKRALAGMRRASSDT